MLAWQDMLRLGLFRLQMLPKDFWALTPFELTLMLGLGDGPAVLTREGLSDLMAAFPDEKDDQK